MFTHLSLGKIEFSNLLAQDLGSNEISLPLILGILAGVLLLFTLAFIATRYRRCPSNEILVVYGKGVGESTAKCVHGGGTFVWPLIQDYAYLQLEPLTVDIELNGALSLKNIRVNVPSTFTIGVSTVPQIMANAAERLLGLDNRGITSQASDIILGQMRLVIATLSIEEINQDREKFLDLVNKNVGFELNKIGLDVINVNIRDITDESGYIEAIGRKAAAEAINQAKIEVAEQNKIGAIGEAAAVREKQVSVSEEMARSAMGQKQAERDQRVKLAELEADGITGESTSKRTQDIAIAEQNALAVQGSKNAEAAQRVKVASLEASAVKGENESRANIAEYQATLDEAQATAKRRGEVAMAEAARDVLRAEKEKEVAMLEKTELAQKEVDKRKIEIEAEAEAERTRRVAKGEADAILLKYEAEAKGIQAVLDAKAEGYQRLLDSVGDDKNLAPTLLMVEQLPGLVKTQVKAIQDLKIDKITVWDSGAGNSEGGSSTSGFLKGLIGSLPPMHELAKQAGVELPQILGKLGDDLSASKNNDSLSDGDKA